MATTIDQAFIKQFEREVHMAYQRQGSYQFSCWNRSDPNFRKLQAVDENDPYFAAALRIARQALMNALDDLTYGATHYHAAGISPYWARGVKPSAVIGNHIFYRIFE